MNVLKRPNLWLILALIFSVTACKPSDDKMRLKLDRRIERSQEKIKKHERKIAGYEQKLRMLADGDTASTRPRTGEKVVTVRSPEQKDFQKFIEIQGAVTSKDNIMVSSNTGGVLMSVAVSEGQRISRGQTIAVVNSDVLQANIKEVENALELATAVWERQKRLWEDQQIGTEVQYLEAENRKENLEKKLETLQVQLNDATVRAPISGMVDEVFGLEGQMVGAGSVIARLVNLDVVQVQAEIPEEYIGKFEQGDRVEVDFPSLGISKSANIKAVGQVINPGNRTFRIVVDLPNSDGMLKPNLLATLKLKEYQHPDQIIVPTRLVQDGSRGNFVFLVERDSVAKRWITTGESYNGETEVLEGLQGGETIIDLGYKEVVEGDRVRIREDV